MRFQDTPELAEWRSTVRGFVKENWLKDSTGDEDEMAMMEGGGDPNRTSRWLDKLAENGWLAPAWPKQYGGADMSVLEQFVLNQELHEVGAPTSRQMLNLVGPTIMLHGTDEQKAEHLPPMLAAKSPGARASASPAPAPTSPACRLAPPATATIMSSTARRSGPPAPTAPTGSSSWPAPTRMRPSTAASATCSST
jgi:alkylation response protein AidB-like acyl-CoA dehydrogenase